MSAVIIAVLDKLRPHLKRQSKSPYKLLSKMTRRGFLYTTKSSFIWIRMGKQTLIIVKKNMLDILNLPKHAKNELKNTFMHTMAIIQKTVNNECWWGYGEKETLVHHWWKWKLVATTMKNGMEVPQKVKNRTTI